MGLTIHYGVSSSTKSTKRAMHYVERMRQLAMDIPFEEVGELIVIDYPPEHKDVKDEALGAMLIDASKYVTFPVGHTTWSEHKSITCRPSHFMGFNIVPGPGSEWASFGLCSYPKVIRYKQYDIPTKLGGWRWGSFCKTQYASNPACGGLPNFLRCHIGIITLLDRIAELPTMKIYVDDEGEYARSNYTDNWRVQNPVYTWHEGKYDPKALAEEVGDWNNMIAGMSGALSDALGSMNSELHLKSQITQFPDFEQLEFKGSQNKDLDTFLKVMEQLVA